MKSRDEKIKKFWRDFEKYPIKDEMKESFLQKVVQNIPKNK